jgi:hypothetical protein
VDLIGGPVQAHPVCLSHQISPFQLLAGQVKPRRCLDATSMASHRNDEAVERSLKKGDAGTPKKVNSVRSPGIVSRLSSFVPYSRILSGMIFCDLVRSGPFRRALVRKCTFRPSSCSFRKLVLKKRQAFQSRDPLRSQVDRIARSNRANNQQLR